VVVVALPLQVLAENVVAAAVVDAAVVVVAAVVVGHAVDDGNGVGKPGRVHWVVWLPWVFLKGAFQQLSGLRLASLLHVLLLLLQDLVAYLVVNGIVAVVIQLVLG